MTSIHDTFDAGAAHYRLTVREREVMWRILSGDTTDQIAQRLSVSPVTVVAHVRNVGTKTTTAKRTASIAKLLGIITEGCLNNAK